MVVTTVDYIDEINTKIFQEIADNLLIAKNYYPCFGEWLTKVEREFTDGKRKIILAKENSTLAGLAILKPSKLCTFWVAPGFRCRGIGAQLMVKSARNGCLLSIENDSRWKFVPLLERFGFEEVGVVRGLYRVGISEHFYRCKSV